MPYTQIFMSAFYAAEGPTLLRDYFKGDLPANHPISKAISPIVKFGEREFQFKQTMMTYQLEKEQQEFESNNTATFEVIVTHDPNDSDDNKNNKNNGNDNETEASPET